MRDPFKSGQIPAGLIAHDLVPVIPSDTGDLGFVSIGFYVQPGGKIRFLSAAGEEREFPVVVNNFQLDVAATKVFATGTERGSGAGGDTDDPESENYVPWIWAKKPHPG